MFVWENIAEKSNRDKREKQAREQIACILGANANQFVTIVTMFSRAQFQKFLIQAMNDMPVNSEKYLLLVEQWRNTPSIFAGELFTLEFAHDVLKHFRNVFPNAKAPVFASTFSFDIRTELLKEKLISLREALGDVKRLSIVADPYSHEINEHPLLLKTSQAGESLTISRGFLVRFVNANKDYFLNKQNYFDLQTINERIEFLWIAMVMPTNPEKLSKPQAYLDFMPPDVSKDISDLKEEIVDLADFAKKSAQLYINDIYALLDKQLTEMESKLANNKLPLHEVMQYVRSDDTGILSALRMIARHAPNDEQSVILQNKFLKKHEKTDEIFLKAWRKHKRITDGQFFPFFNISEVQPLNHYLKHATYRTSVYQEILAKQKQTDVKLCPVGGYPNVDFVGCEQQNNNDTARCAATYFVIKTMRYIPYRNDSNGKLNYKALQPHLGSVALMPEIGEQLSKLEHPVLVDIREIIARLELSAPEVLPNLNQYNLFKLLKVLNTDKIAFTNFGENVFDSIAKLHEHGYQKSTDYITDLPVKIFHTLLASERSNRFGMDFIDTDFLIKNHAKFLNYCHKVKTHNNQECIEYLIGKVHDRMTVKELGQRSPQQKPKLKV